MRVPVTFQLDAAHSGLLTRPWNVSRSGSSVPAFSQRAWSAGAVAQRLTATLQGSRPGSEVGTWLMAVDPSTVEYTVFLPCLPAAGGGRSEDCSGRGWRHVKGQAALWVDMALVALAFGMLMVGPACIAWRCLSPCIRGGAIEDVMYPWGGVSPRVGGIADACRSLGCAMKGLQARLGVIAVFRAGVSMPGTVWISLVFAMSVLRTLMVVLGHDAAGLAVPRS